MFDRFDSLMASGALIGILGIPYLSDYGFDKDVFIYLTITILFLCILLLGEFLHLFFKISPEFARITSHVLAGLSSLLILNKFSSPLYVLALCIQSALFLIFTAKMGILKSHHDVERKTYGSSLFFAGVFLTFFTSVLTLNRSLFILPVLILTISDPIAALTGQNIKSGYWINIISGKKSFKTFAGSFAFFISSFFILLIGLPFFFNYSLPARLIISLTTGLIVTLIETISSSGFDNLTIQASVLFLLLISESLF